MAPEAISITANAIFTSSDRLVDGPLVSRCLTSALSLPRHPLLEPLGHGPSIRLGFVGMSFSQFGGDAQS